MVGPDDAPRPPSVRPHPNDPQEVRDQLSRSVLLLSREERASLIASIDRTLARLDASA